MTKCKDCKYFEDPVIHQVKDPELLHICDNTEKSGYAFCKVNADGCAEFEAAMISPADALDIPYSAQACSDQIMELLDQQRKHQEKELAWIITHYDFIVGSKECGNRLMEILPDEANIIYSPYVEDPTMIYAVKKFDIKDLINLEDGIKFGDQDTLMPAT